MIMTKAGGSSFSHWTSSEIGQNKLNFKLVFPISEEVYSLIFEEIFGAA